MILKSLFARNWKTTLTGIITGGALGYAGYSTGNPELIIAGATAAAGGIMGRDATTTKRRPKKAAQKIK